MNWIVLLKQVLLYPHPLFMVPSFSALVDSGRNSRITAPNWQIPSCIDVVVKTGLHFDGVFHSGEQPVTCQAVMIGAM